MAGMEPRSQDARLEDRQASLDGDAAIPSWATDGLTERWNAADSLARRLESRGVDAGQVYILLDALLPSGWDSDTGIELGSEESAWFLRELGFLGSATFTILFMCRVVEAEASLAGIRRPATMPTVCQYGCNRRVNLLNSRCCHTCPMRHTGQCLEMQLGTEDAQCSAEGRSSAMPDDQELAFAMGNLAPRTAALDRRMGRGRRGSTPSNREARARAIAGPYSRTPSDRASTPARERQASEAAAFLWCRLCNQRPCASGLAECWTCFLG